MNHAGTSSRDAVAMANIDATAGQSGSISFVAGLNGQTITLSQGVLVLWGAGAGSITIDGANQIRIDGNQASEIYQVNQGVTAIIENQTLTDGNAPTADDGQ